MTTTCTMILGDCMEVMPTLKQISIKALLCDFPYGITSLHWDTKLALDVFFDIWCKVRKKNSIAMCFADFSLLRKLVETWGNEFRYELVWAKTRGSNPLVAKHRPVPAHEFIGIFAPGKIQYMSQMELSRTNPRIRTPKTSSRLFGITSAIAARTLVSDSHRHPLSVRICSCDSLSRNGSPENANTQYHPTQKPKLLVEWLLRSFVPVGETILDPTGGGGTTVIAATSVGRDVIFIEKEERFFEAAVDRTRKHIRNKLLDVKLEVRK